MPGGHPCVTVRAGFESRSTMVGKTRTWNAAWAWGFALSAPPILGGCVSAPVMAVRAERYQISASLDPPSHTLKGRATIDLVRADRPPIAAGPVAVEIWLHPDLDIVGVRAAGASLQSRSAKRLADMPMSSSDVSGEATDFHPARYLVTLSAPVEALTLFVDYRGRLFQDVSAGEKPGEIHNFTMRAHIGPEGVYLADGYWYPQPAHEKDALRLAEFELSADAPPGFELVASGDRDEALRARTGRASWRSPYPLPEMVLVGGPHQVHRDRHNNIDIAVHLKPSQSPQAGGWIAAIKRNLDRYEPLIGPYPGKQYTVVDNFFSSGFAFPFFTLLSSAVIEMGERAQTSHGYLDHEMLHSWWGNAIFVDPRDGNWCEALTSYAANYFGHVLDGKEEEARRKRRNYCHYLSRLKPEDDKPLGTFGRPEGCNRQIAYDKGAMVFHMLAQTMGQDRFWAAMRALTLRSVGHYASWDDLRRVCELETRMDLQPFFRQWVRGFGAPRIGIDNARYESASNALTVSLSQDRPFFRVDDLQIRVYDTPDRWIDLHTRLLEPGEVHRFDVKQTPHTVELDPDYHVLRKISPDELVPTTAATRRGASFACILPWGLLADEYVKLKRTFDSSYVPTKRIERVSGQIEEGALAQRCTLILGDAVLDPYVDGFLTAIEFPVGFSDDGFEFDGEDYDDPGDAVLCTISHPGVPGGGVTVVYANSDEAIPRTNAVPMYEHSLVIFRDGHPVLRQDFERRTLVNVPHE